LLDAAEAEAATAKLCDRLSLPVVAHETFSGELLHTPAGEAVIDLGQEITGTFRLRVCEPAGTVVRVQCAELLQDGNFYRDNLRSAKSEFTYVSDGVEHVLEPRFTFYGYRYAKIEVDGQAPKRFDVADFTGVALWSDFEEIGRLHTDSAMVNQLISNATWGMRDNFLDTPTDCPQRDERLGWTGDAQVFSPTALYLADQYPFYRKYLHDMALEQEKLGGAVPMVVPAFMLNSAANAVWGDVTCIIPWNMYLMSGDATILAEHFVSMRDWVDYVARVDGDHHGWREVFQFGDWLALDGPKGERTGGTDEGFIADLYFWRSACIVRDAAQVLGDEESEARYAALADRLASWIEYEYFSASGRCVVNTQTAYALAIVSGFGDTEFSARALGKLLSRNDGKLTTGFVGTAFLNRALSETGLAREAFD
ncbi:MAG: family 78 glycoside hydrolase catalytic domain, partial [Atopobiaceae bacterium]|nr:family 78 glycoside hydrolase catalytic domain [Atopobiaceae bacterium]